jgi:hypothetical protein
VSECNYFNSYHANKLSQKIVSLINNIIPDTDIDEGVKRDRSAGQDLAAEICDNGVYHPKQR